jgi:hypothetical protein
MLERYLRMNQGLGDDVLRRIAAPQSQARYHMPPGGSLSAAQISAIKDFIAHAQ